MLTLAVVVVPVRSRRRSQCQTVVESFPASHTRVTSSASYFYHINFTCKTWENMTKPCNTQQANKYSASSITVNSRVTFSNLMFSSVTESSNNEHKSLIYKRRIKTFFLFIYSSCWCLLIKCWSVFTEPKRANLEEIASSFNEHASLSTGHTGLLWTTSKKGFQMTSYQKRISFCGHRFFVSHSLIICCLQKWICVRIM